MFAGTRGGYNRGFILKYFIDKQYDLNQLAEALSLDYKTTVHHLDILTPIFALSTMFFQGISVISKELKRLPMSEKKIIVISI